MAGAERDLTKTLAVATLLIGAVMACLAQSVEGGAEQDRLTVSRTGSELTGSLNGKLTDRHSNPLAGVPVVARNQATGTETQTITTKNGSYRFTGLEPGEYALEAENPQLGRGHVEGIVVDAGYEAQVQAAMELEPFPREAILAVLRKRSEPWPEQEALLVREVALATEPLLQFSVRARRLSDLVGDGPRTEIPVLNVLLASEPLWTLKQAGRSGERYAPSAVEASTSGQVSVNESQVPKCEGPGAPGDSTSGQVSVNESQVPKCEGPGAPGASDSQVPKCEGPGAPGAWAPASTTTMTAAELQALPVNGRHWQDFVLDNTPTSATQAAGQGQISLRGVGEQAETAVDGVSRGLAFGPTSGSGQGSSGSGGLGQNGEGPAGMAQVGSGGHGLAVSEAAIRTVETEAGNVEAAADRAASGRMNVETQSGANEMHGQGFLFDRESAWGAQNPFAQWVKETVPATETTVPVFTPESYTPPDRETVWGIGAGSRIRRDKLFWFAALDSYNRNDPGLATVKIPSAFFAQPTNDQMQVLSARLGLSSANPVAEGLAAYSGLLETMDGLLGPAPRTATQWTGFGRLDWQAAERHRFTLEGIGANWNSPGGGLTRVSETFGNHSFGSSTASEEWLLGRWEAFLTANLLATTQASVGHAVQEARPETPSTYEQSFLAGNAWGQLPQIVVDSSYGFTIGNPSRFGQGSFPDEHLYHGQESVDWVRDKLLVKAGFEANHNADTTSLLRNQTGTYNYANVENFASDALVFSKFGLTGALNPFNQQNCDQTGKVWRDSAGNLRGLGNLPCYSSYSQTIGPSDWRLTTNDWAGFATAQWQAGKLMVVSGGLRWEREQLPPPLAVLNNPALPRTETLPSLGNNWGPRVSVAVGNSSEKHWPVLRLGYGMYFGRTDNLAVETALTQTGSLSGDLNYFMRPTDNLNLGGAPPFPYVLRPPGPASVVEPGAVEFAPGLRNPEIHQGVMAVEETLPSHVEVTASVMVSLGRRLPISIDTNLDSPTPTETITYNVCDQTPTGLNIGVCGNTGQGPIKAAQITVPFYASWPAETGVAGRPNANYQQITQIMSRANSTYEAAMLRVERYGRHGLSLHAHYVYSHAMDWNPNESAQAAGNDVLDPADFSQEYGTSNLDMRHSASAMAIYETPWKLRGRAGNLGNGWMLSGVGQFRSGLPYTMRTGGSLPEEFDAATGAAIAGLGPGMNGSGGDNRVYGLGSDGRSYNIGRNTYRYPATWKADLRLGRRFDLGKMRQLELLAESFNLFNHQNVTELETTGYTVQSGSPPTTLGTTGTPPTLNFLTGLKVNATTGLSSAAFGQPLNVNATNFYRERQIQFGLRLRF
ncbi:MAG: carboxypeptidase-like regulatory domain-containing protein [Terracidiphilus sp.]